MTVAIGLICKHPKNVHPPSIILASDSQTSHGQAKSLDAKKINIVNFKDAQILIAQSGTAQLADAAVQKLCIKARDVSFDSPEVVPRLLEETMREIRAHLIGINTACNFSEDG